MIEIQKYNLFPKSVAFKNFKAPNVASFPSFSGKNLAPLEQDTISFTSRKHKMYHSAMPEDVVTYEELRDEHNSEDVVWGGYSPQKEGKTVKRSSKGLDPSDLGSQKVAADILEEIDFAYGRFKNDIGAIFNMSVIDTSMPNYQTQYFSEVKSNYESGSPVLAITARKKSKESLMEKMGSRKIRTKKGAKEEITDILGVRILLSGAQNHPGDYVMEKLTDAVNKGWIKIVEIENMKNPDIKPYAKYAYANQSKIDNLATAVRKRGTKNFTNRTLETESGYTAIHILCEFPQNIKGELQIIGPDVLRLKEIEDICYKSLSGKRVAKRYSGIQKMFSGMKEGDPQYVEFMDYTRKAYAAERKRPPHPMNDCSLRFLELPSDSILSPQYDFNSIERMKNQADKDYQKELKSKEQK